MLQVFDIVRTINTVLNNFYGILGHKGDKCGVTFIENKRRIKNVDVICNKIIEAH